MNLFFNKYNQEGNANLKSTVVLPSGFISVGNKGPKGYVLFTDKMGKVIWEKVYEVKGKNVNFLQVSDIKADQVLILGNATIAEKNIQTHLVIGLNINGKINYSNEINSGTISKTCKLLKLSGNEWIITGWKKINTTSCTEYYKINANGQITESTQLITKGNNYHFDIDVLEKHLIFGGYNTNKENKDGLIVIPDLKTNNQHAFVLNNPELGKDIEIGALRSLGKGSFVFAGITNTDIFVTKGVFKQGSIEVEPLRLGFLTGSFKVLKILIKDPFTYVLAYDTKTNHHFVIKFDLSKSNFNQAKTWIKYIGAGEVALPKDIIFNEEGFLLCGFISKEKNEFPILINSDEAFNVCTVENGSNVTKDIKPIKLIVTKIDLKVDKSVFTIANFVITGSNNQSQQVNLCQSEELPIQKCPFAMTAWNTIEPRARTRDFTKALQVEVRDAMWMISRQWQWGEFDGEDGGSIVYSKLAFNTTKLNRYTQLEKSPAYEAYNDQEPLEYTVERGIVNIEKNWLLRIEVGNYWVKLLKNKFENPKLEELKRGFISQYAVLLPEEPVVIDHQENQEHIEYLQLKTNEETWLMLVSAQNRTIDGWLFIEAIQNGSHFSHDFIEDATVLSELLEEFKLKYGQVFFNEFNISSSWSAKQLEHNFQGRAKNTDISKDDFKILGKEYSGKNLDWIDMDVAVGGKDFLDKPGATIENSVVEPDVNILIPSKIFFPGMPEARWWQMEDGQIDFGNMIVNKTDLSKLLLLDFMLNYAGNWYMLPHAAEVGTLTEIQGIEVRDNFGIRTLVQPANIVDAPTGNQRKWSVFQLHNESGSVNVPASLLFLAPTTPDKLEGKPIEKVNFIRDEMANMVWGIEQTINSGMNKGTDGNEAGIRLQQLLKKYNENLAEDDVTENENNENILKYKLATSVPENWIPFIPVNTDTSNRSIKLRRAKTLRAIENFAGKIKPRTDLLSPRTDLLSPPPPYFINEEEVPKAGRIVEAKWQRARWFDGKTYVWYGHEKKVGRGGGTSGLKFDQLEYDKK